MPSLISIIIPSYNHQEYVLQAIESVLAQDWPTIDLIVIDDGSHDASPSLIKKFHDNHGGFRYYNRENRGLLNTLSEGLNLAKGKYFCELASDDFLPKNSISSRAHVLEKKSDHIAVFTDGLIVHEDKITNDRIIDLERKAMFESKDPIPYILEGKGPVFSTGLFHTESFINMGGFDKDNFRFYEDLDTPIRLCLAGKIAYIDKPLFFRRYHDTNVSTTTNSVRIEKVVAFKMLLENPKMKPYSALLRKRYIQTQITLAKAILENKQVNLNDVKLLNSAWPYARHSLKLLWYLLRVKKRKLNNT